MGIIAFEMCVDLSELVLILYRLAGFPCFFVESEDGGTTSTYEKILNWRQTVEEVLADVDLSPEAMSMIRCFLTDSKERLGSRGSLF